MEKIILGSHVSYNKNEGLTGSVKEALSYNANTFMFYTGAPQNTFRSKIDEENVKNAQKLMKENNIDIKNVIIHAPYIINLANNKDEEKWKFTVNFLKEEVERAKKFGVNKIVLHPGSHVGLGVEKGLENIANGLNLVLTEEEGPIICLETMAGKGTEVGTDFLQLNQIIKNVKNKKRIMVCIDTCHIYDAGYDVSNFDAVLDDFDEVIGLDKLGCIHLNDDKNQMGSHKDRHANIGFGTIGFENIEKIAYNPRVRKLPLILETPYVSKEKDGTDRSYPPYKFEIEMIRNDKFDKNMLTEIRNYYR